MESTCLLLLLIFVVIQSCHHVAVEASLLAGNHGVFARGAEDDASIHSLPQIQIGGSSAFVLPENYSSLIPPPTPSGEPARVEFSVVVMNLRDIKETTQELSLEMNLRVYWTDIRLKNLTQGQDHLVLNPATIVNSIWRPDAFIDHVKSIPTPALMSKPASLRLFEDGSVRYSARITIVMSCHMDFKYYPADTQRCNIDLKSYAYPNNILVLGWHKGVSAVFVANLTIPNYMIKLDGTEEFTTKSTSGIYSAIRFTVSLKRELSYHLLQTYLPSTLFMVASWLTFIMPQDNGAITICMTTLLTITAMFAAVRQNTPNVSYAKAIDIWMVVCLFFLFLSLAQHAITLRLRHMKIKLNSKKRRMTKAQMASKQAASTHDQNDDSPVDEDPSVLGVAYRANGKESFQLKNVANENQNSSLSREDSVNRRYAEPPKVPAPPPPEEEIAATANEYKVLGNKIRKVFTLATPICFGIFNMIYWPWLLRSSRYWD